MITDSSELQYQSHRYSLAENKEPFIEAQPRLAEMKKKSPFIPYTFPLVHVSYSPKQMSVCYVRLHINSTIITLVYLFFINAELSELNTRNKWMGVYDEAAS